MRFPSKDWKALPDTTTPTSPAALEDAELRAAEYGARAALRPLNHRPKLRLNLLDIDPIVTGTDAVGLSLYWFGVMRVTEILGEDALDNYYAWESTDHDNAYAGGPHLGGVFYRTAPTPTGPWSARTLAFRDLDYPSETETPSVLYVPEDPNGRPFYCYYQQSAGGVDQFTRLRSSANGTTGWVQETCQNLTGTIVAPNDTRLMISVAANDAGQIHTGYLNPQALGSMYVGYSRVSGAAPEAFGVWYSMDGKSWALHPFFYRYFTRFTGSPATWLAPTQFNLLRWRGQLYTLTTTIAGTDRTPLLLPMSEDCRTILGPGQQILTPTESWEGITKVNHLRPFQDIDGRMYVYVTYRPVSQSFGGVATGVYELVED